MIYVFNIKGIHAGFVGDLMMKKVESRFRANGQPASKDECVVDGQRRFLHGF